MVTETLTPTPEITQVLAQPSSPAAAEVAGEVQAAQQPTISTNEEKQAEAKILVKNLLYMSVERMANGREPLGRGYKKVFAKHLFMTTENLRKLLDELGMNVTVGVKIGFVEKEKPNG